MVKREILTSPVPLTHGMNSAWNWFSSNKKGYRKKKNDNILLLVFSMFYFVCIYSNAQYLCFGLYAYLNMCLLQFLQLISNKSLKSCGKKIFSVNDS